MNRSGRVACDWLLAYFSSAQILGTIFTLRLVHRLEPLSLMLGISHASEGERDQHQPVPTRAALACGQNSTKSPLIMLTVYGRHPVDDLRFDLFGVGFG